MNHLTIAPLKNVSSFSELCTRVMSLPDHLPRMATFHGPSGYGKTFAAQYAANVHGAYHIEMRECWNKGALTEELCKILGILPKRTIPQRMNDIAEHLANEDRLLIIDEADFLVQKKFIEIVRDIYEMSGAPIILIGEELLPKKLAEFERFHNRMVDWVPAQPADMSDIKYLAKLHCKDIEISEFVLEHIFKTSGGRLRRIATSLNVVREHAQVNGLAAVEKKDVENIRFSTGIPPQRRAHQ